MTNLLRLSLISMLCLGGFNAICGSKAQRVPEYGKITFGGELKGFYASALNYDGTDVRKNKYVSGEDAQLAAILNVRLSRILGADEYGAFVEKKSDSTGSEKMKAHIFLKRGEKTTFKIGLMETLFADKDLSISDSSLNCGYSSNYGDRIEDIFGNRALFHEKTYLPLYAVNGELFTRTLDHIRSSGLPSSKFGNIIAASFVTEVLEDVKVGVQYSPKVFYDVAKASESNGNYNAWLNDYKHLLTAIARVDKKVSDADLSMAIGFEHAVGSNANARFQLKDLRGFWGGIKVDYAPFVFFLDGGDQTGCLPSVIRRHAAFTQDDGKTTMLEAAKVDAEVGSLGQYLAFGGAFRKEAVQLGLRFFYSTSCQGYTAGAPSADPSTVTDSSTSGRIGFARLARIEGLVQYLPFPTDDVVITANVRWNGIRDNSSLSNQDLPLNKSTSISGAVGIKLKI